MPIDLSVFDNLEEELGAIDVEFEAETPEEEGGLTTTIGTRLESLWKNTWFMLGDRDEESLEETAEALSKGRHAGMSTELAAGIQEIDEANLAWDDPTKTALEAFGESFWAIVENPGAFTYESLAMLGESSPYIVGSMLGATAGGAALGPAGAVGGMVLGGLATGTPLGANETFMEEVIAKAGGYDKEKIKEVLRDEAFIDDLTTRAAKGGGAMAGTDMAISAALSTVPVVGRTIRSLKKAKKAYELSSKTAKDVLKYADDIAKIKAKYAAATTTPKNVARGTAILAGEIGSEGLSEYARMLAADQEISASSIAQEMFYAGGTSAAMSAVDTLVNRAGGKGGTTALKSQLNEMDASAQAAIAKIEKMRRGTDAVPLGQELVPSDAKETPGAEPYGEPEFQLSDSALTNDKVFYEEVIDEARRQLSYARLQQQRLNKSQPEYNQIQKIIDATANMIDTLLDERKAAISGAPLGELGSQIKPYLTRHLQDVGPRDLPAPNRKGSVFYLGGPVEPSPPTPTPTSPAEQTQLDLDLQKPELRQQGNLGLSQPAQPPVQTEIESLGKPPRRLQPNAGKPVRAKPVKRPPGPVDKQTDLFPGELRVAMEEKAAKGRLTPVQELKRWIRDNGGLNVNPKRDDSFSDYQENVRTQARGLYRMRDDLGMTHDTMLERLVHDGFITEEQAQDYHVADAIVEAVLRDEMPAEIVGGTEAEWDRQAEEYYADAEQQYLDAKDDLTPDESTDVTDMGEAAFDVAPTAPTTYPEAPRDEWYSDADYEARGGEMITMTPDEFLAEARPLEIDDASRDNIEALKDHIREGKTLDPLSLYSDGKEDGRHRAIAAKELGITEVPVVDLRGEVTHKAPDEYVEHAIEERANRVLYYLNALDETTVGAMDGVEVTRVLKEYTDVEKIPHRVASRKEILLQEAEKAKAELAGRKEKKAAPKKKKTTKKKAAPKSDLEKAAEENKKLRVNKLRAANRFVMQEGKLSGNRLEFKYTIEGIEDWSTVENTNIDPDTGKVFKTRNVLYDPDIATPRKTEDKWGVTYKFDLKDGWVDDLKLTGRDDLMYRGMSWEEWQAIQDTGIIRSKGEYNFDNQKGQTMFSSDINQAANYAHGFAPTEYSATPEKLAVVVGVKKRKSAPQPHAASDTTEIAIPDDISMDEIVEVWEGHPYAVTGEGAVEVVQDIGRIINGSSHPPGVAVAWKRTETPEVKTPEEIDQTLLNAVEDEDYLNEYDDYADIPDFTPDDFEYSLRARAADKFFDSEELAEAGQEKFKSRETLIYLTPQEFLGLAESRKSGKDKFKAARVKEMMDNGKPMSLPYLLIERDAKNPAVYRVVGHEGRHRADALMAQDYEEMPVILKSTEPGAIRWSEQRDINARDRIDVWPSWLVGEDGISRMEFPVPDPSLEYSVKEQAAFFSALTRGVNNVQMPKAPPQQWAGMLRKMSQQGVKQEELQWSGVLEWLEAQDGTVTKEELLNYLWSQEVYLDEVRYSDEITQEDADPQATRVVIINEGNVYYGNRRVDNEWQVRYTRDGQDTTKADVLNEAQSFFLEAVDELEETMGRGYLDDTTPEADREVELSEVRALAKGKARANVGSDDVFTATSKEELPQILADIDKMDFEGRRTQVTWRDATGLPKYKGWMSPGGVNYNELLLTLNDTPRNRSTYESDHWDTPNIVLHVRFDQRTIDGRKVLFIQEIQSDWHQAGRQRGYMTRDSIPTDPQSLEKQRFKVTDMLASEGISLDTVLGALSRPDTYTLRQWRDQNTLTPDDIKNPDTRAAYDRLLQINEAVAADPFEQRQRVPDAPFKKSWPLLAFKRMLRWAAEKDFDQIMWTGGEIQVDRYDLGRVVQKISYSPYSEERKMNSLYGGEFEVIAEDLRGREIPEGSGSFSAQRLEEVFGRDIANRIINNEGVQSRDDAETFELTGVQLQVGGEGMRAFYDRMLPKEVGKYVKKWKGKVSPAKISTRSSDDTAVTQEQLSALGLKDHPIESALIFDDTAPRKPNGSSVAIRKVTNTYTGESKTFPDTRAGRKASEKYSVEQLAKIIRDKDVWSVDITPQMREAALAGQPLFSAKQVADNLEQYQGGTRRKNALTEDEVKAELYDRVGKETVDLLVERGILNFGLPTGANRKRAQGVYKDGKAWLNPDMIAEGESFGVLMHELGEHYGMRRLVGPRVYDQILSRVEHLVRSGDEAMVAAWERASAAKSPTYRETLAYFLQDSANENTSLYRQVVARVKAFFMRIFPRIAQTLKPADLRVLAVAAIRRAGKPLRKGDLQTSPAYSRDFPPFMDFSEEKVRKILSQEGPNGVYFTRMSAKDFLGLTGSPQRIQDILDGKDDAVTDMYTRVGSYQKGSFSAQEADWMGDPKRPEVSYYPKLYVSAKGEVMNHEGRHRAAFLLRGGADTIPVAILPDHVSEKGVVLWTDDWAKKGKIPERLIGQWDYHTPSDKGYGKEPVKVASLYREVDKKVKVPKGKLLNQYSLYEQNEVDAALEVVGPESNDQVEYSIWMPFTRQQEAMTEDQQLNAEIRARRGVREAFSGELQRQLFPGGELPEAAFEAMIRKNAKQKGVEYGVSNLNDRLIKAMKAAKFTSPEQARIADEVLKGNTDLWDQVPAPVLDILVGADRQSGMRKRIDRLTLQYVAAQRRIMEAMPVPEQGTPEFDIYQAKIDLMNTFTDTLLGRRGEYANRSYQVFDDPKWYKKVPEEVLNRARAYLIREYVGSGLTRAKAVQRAQHSIEEILKDNTAYDDVFDFVYESKLGAMDLRILKKRKDIPEEIRALMGEYHDPRINFPRTTSKLSRLVFNDMFLREIYDNFVDNDSGFLYTKDNAPPSHRVKLANFKDPKMAPLNGLYTTKEIARAFKEIVDAGHIDGLYQTIVGYNAWIKVGKTIYSPITQVRNFISAAFFAVAGGHFNPLNPRSLADFGKSVGYLKSYVSHKGQWNDEIQHMIELGVLYETPSVQELRDALKDFQGGDHQFEYLTGMKQRAYGWHKKAMNVYRFSDDFWKIIGFHSELRYLTKHHNIPYNPERLGDSSMRSAEQDALFEKLKAQAAKRIRDTYPTYSMTGQLQKKLAKFPLVGTFISFPSEVVRTSWNSLEYLWDDMKNPVMRPMAFKRAFGIATAGFMMKAIQEFLFNMHGIDDDEEEAIRQLAAPWSRNSQIAYLGKDPKTGRDRFIDLSYMDPYNYLKRPFVAATRPNRYVGERIFDILKEIGDPFLGPDIAAQAIYEAASNRKATGSEVRNPAEEWYKQVGDAVQYIAKTVQPGATAHLNRIIKAQQGETTSTGKKYSLGDELLAFSGARVSTLDAKAALEFRGRDFSNQERASVRIITTPLKDLNPVKESSLRSDYGRFLKARNKTYRDIVLLVDAARRSGASEQEIRAGLKGGGISKTKISSLMRGKIPVWKPSKSFSKRTRIMFKRRAETTEAYQTYMRQYNERLRWLRRWEQEFRRKGTT